MEEVFFFLVFFTNILVFLYKFLCLAPRQRSFSNLFQWRALKLALKLCPFALLIIAWFSTRLERGKKDLPAWFRKLLWIIVGGNNCFDGKLVHDFGCPFI
jgi:hypothetical protein